jgi:AraC-like DNA-binding protein
MRTECVVPARRQWRWDEQLANLESYSRALEESLTSSLDDEDVARAIPRLAVPDLADFSIVEVIEGDQCVRSTFAHRDPAKTEAVRTLIDGRAELRNFKEGRRALSGESVLFHFSGATVRQQSMRASEMSELIRLLQPTSAMFVPFTVLGETVAVAGFMATAESALTHGARELALAEEMSRRALVRHAGFAALHRTSSEDARLRRVCEFMRENLGAPVSLAALARVASLSRFHVLRLFRQAYGETPLKYLTRLRMEEAQRRLTSTMDSVTEIALACGYDNSGHFASAFRRVFGMSPTSFRRLAR